VRLGPLAPIGLFALLAGCFAGLDERALTAGGADLGAGSPVASKNPRSCHDFSVDLLGSLPNGWFVTGGAWRVVADGSARALGQTATVDGRCTAATAAPGDDVIWTVVVEPASSHSTDCAVARDSSTDNSRYELCLSSGSGWTLERDHGATHTVLDSGKRSYDVTKPHTLVLTARGAQLSGDIDGDRVVEHTDGELVHGGVGVATDGTSRFSSACVQVP
jgi:hypothetical protein